MPDMLIVTVIVLALVFDYLNGFHDTSNAIATSVSTRALSPMMAVFMSAILNFLGALYSTGVAKTIGGDIVQANMINEYVVIAAILGAIIWNLITWWFGLPSSSSHALIGGIIGAVIVAKGLWVLKFGSILKIIASLVLSPLFALLFGFVVMMVLIVLFGQMAPFKINSSFKRLQVITAALMSFSHGSNDAQKSMGIITLTLLSSGYISTLEVPLWVKVITATAMALGTAAGGWRIIKTMGGKIFKLEPMSGFGADLNSSIVIFGATMLNLPVSTTYVASGSIMGVGAAKRINAVHWNVATQIVIAWLITIPSTALVSGISYRIIELYIIK